VGIELDMEPKKRHQNKLMDAEGWVNKRIERSWHWPISQYFDTWAKYQDQPQASGVDWVRVWPFIGVHLACLGVIWVGWRWVAIAMALFLYAIRMFAITGFYHRYFSHRTFKTSRVAQFLFAVLGNASVQRGPLWWAGNHRHHHRYSDEAEDIHSPHRDGFLWSHVLWLTTREHFSTDRKAMKDLIVYPELRFLDRFDMVVPFLLAIGLYSLGMGLEMYAPGLGTTGLQMLIWGFFISTVVLLHATCTINSLSHQFGSRRFDTSDESKNNGWLALLTFGEGWHNNHHHYPGSVRQGFYWWEIDVTFYGLWVLEKLGVVWDLNRVPERVYEENDLTGGRRKMASDER